MGFAVLLHLLAVLFMVASPALHSAAHPDSDEPEHSCCVTLFEAGSFHAPTVDADFSVDADLPLIGGIQLPAERIAAVRCSAGALEHAPPAAA